MGCKSSKPSHTTQPPSKQTGEEKRQSPEKNTKPSSEPQPTETKKTPRPEIKLKKDRAPEEDYIMGEILGKGAFSVVRKATSIKNQEVKAIKIVDKTFIDNSDLQLLEREIQIMSSVDHPNVLRLDEVYDNTQTIGMVMELVDGGELFYKIVQQGNYNEKDAASIVRQMIEGVSYLHKQSICHRDLKPENLLVSSNGPQTPFRLLIADFGLSKSFKEGALETSCGTPDYVAPEVITSEGTYDESVDMWSCGVITYVLLCGFSPFLSTSEKGLFDKIIKAEYDFPEPEWTEISEHAKDFIRHLLVKDPRKRMTGEECLAHPWLNGQVGQAKLGGGEEEFAERMNTYNEMRKHNK